MTFTCETSFLIYRALRGADSKSVVPILNQRLVYLMDSCKDELSCVDPIALLSTWNSGKLLSTHLLVFTFLSFVYTLFKIYLFSGLEALQISLLKVLQYISRAMHRVKWYDQCKYELV